VENGLLAFYRNRVLTLLGAGGAASVLPLVKEMLEALAQAKAVSASVAAETCFAAARVYWQLGNFAEAGRAVTKAAVTCPAWVAGLPWRGFRRVSRRASGGTGTLACGRPIDP
jgi:hypothetical protein